jgi:hypothetical protein
MIGSLMFQRPKNRIEKANDQLTRRSVPCKKRNVLKIKQATAETVPITIRKISHSEVIGIIQKKGFPHDTPGVNFQLVDVSILSAGSFFLGGASPPHRFGLGDSELSGYLSTENFDSPVIPA